MTTVPARSGFGESSFPGSQVAGYLLAVSSHCREREIKLTLVSS
jgi:hypothetical protein